MLKLQAGERLPTSLERTVVVTTQLRGVGYPAPRYVLADVAGELGVSYSVLEALPGEPLGTRLDQRTLDQLMGLNDLQQGLASEPVPDWPRDVVRTVLEGGDDFCLLEPMRAYSAGTAGLLAHLQSLAVLDPGDYRPANDIVHFDFQGANILIDGLRISGVVDWEGTRPGDCSFDLATLFFYADPAYGANPDQSERLWRILRAGTDPIWLRVYLAHLCLRQIDWSIRFHDAGTVDRYLARARAVLRQLAHDASPSSKPWVGPDRRPA